MNITLTRTQWESLKDLVLLGKRTERALGLSIEIVNGDQKIEITSEETIIVLDD